MASKIDKFYFSELLEHIMCRRITGGGALESPDIGQPFKHLEHMFTTIESFLRAPEVKTF